MDKYEYIEVTDQGKHALKAEYIESIASFIGIEYIVFNGQVFIRDEDGDFSELFEPDNHWSDTGVVLNSITDKKYDYACDCIFSEDGHCYQFTVIDGMSNTTHTGTDTDHQMAICFAVLTLIKYLNKL